MRPPIELVYRELAVCQVGYGGYTEEDVTKLRTPFFSDPIPTGDG